MQREFDVVQQVCSKKLTSYGGYKENLKKKHCCIDGGSISRTDWFKVTKVITLKTQYCSVDKVGERGTTKTWILYYLFRLVLLLSRVS